MVFSSCDAGPAGRMHPGTEQAPNSRHRRREFGTNALRTRWSEDWAVEELVFTTANDRPVDASTLPAVLPPGMHEGGHRAVAAV